MPYDAKPLDTDVILSTFEERDRLAVTLYLREGADGFGAEVADWRDEDCAQMFEDGFLKRARVGRLSDGDGDLLRSSFEYARDHGLPALAKFETDLAEAVAGTEAGLLAAYGTLDASEGDVEGEEPDERRERLIEALVERTLGAAAYAKVSEARVEDLREHFTARLEDVVPAPASAPAP